MSKDGNVQLELENAELKQRVEALSNELEASLRREELLREPKNVPELSWKNRIKNTKIGRRIFNHDSVIGKVVRSPRTIYRILRSPSIIKDIRTIKQEDKEREHLFVPIDFFCTEIEEERVNLVLPKLSVDELKVATKLANERGCELRVITYLEPPKPSRYQKLVKDGLVPKAKKISFYSPLGQMATNGVYKLEVGKKELFVTTVWENNDGK